VDIKRRKRATQNLSPAYPFNRKIEKLSLSILSKIQGGKDLFWFLGVFQGPSVNAFTDKACPDENHEKSSFRIL